VIEAPPGQVSRNPPTERALFAVSKPAAVHGAPADDEAPCWPTRRIAPPPLTIPLFGASIGYLPPGGTRVRPPANRHASRLFGALLKPAFQPYWGKPAVRNDRKDRGNVGIIRSPVRASILPDSH
jgi:hypothetical protein